VSLDLKMSRGMPVIVQCADLQASARWIDAMRRYGTNVVACVAPAADGEDHSGLPVFRHCADALAEKTEVETCVSIAQPRSAADALLEAAEAGVRLIVSLSVGVPVHDIMRAHRRIEALGVTLFGAASSGIALPAAGIMLGAIPDASLRPGDVALVSASGSLAAEAGYQMGEAGLGQSLYIDVGSDIVKGTRMAALTATLMADASTRAVALIGTAQGTEEEEFSATIQSITFDKPVLAYIAGLAAPDREVRNPMEPSAAEAATRKAAALAEAGADVYNSLGALVAALKALP